MKVRFLLPWGQYQRGDTAELPWSLGANLVFAARAVEVKEEAKSLDNPPADKAIKRAPRKKERSDCANQDDKGLRTTQDQLDTQGG